MSKSSPNTPQALIRAAALTPLVDFIADSAGSPGETLGALGADLASLADPYAQISLSHYVELLEKTALALAEPNLGLRMALRLRPADLGPMGVLFSISPTIRSGLARLSEHVSALQDSTHSSLFELGQELVWTYRIAEPSIWPRRQDAEFSLATVCQLVRLSFAPGWCPVEVHLEHGPQADPALLQRVFRAPVLFHQSANRLILSRDEAMRRHRSEDAGLARILERHIADLRDQHSPSATLADQIRRVIALSLGQRPVTLATVAAELRLSTRSLQRRLADEGTSLRALIQEHRQGLAWMLLEQSDMRLSQVAGTLGYADGTVFWRAFRTWTGQEPSATRRPQSTDPA